MNEKKDFELLALIALDKINEHLSVIAEKLNEPGKEQKKSSCELCETCKHLSNALRPHRMFVCCRGYNMGDPPVISCPDIQSCIHHEQK